MTSNIGRDALLAEWKRQTERSCYQKKDVVYCAGIFLFLISLLNAFFNSSRRRKRRSSRSSIFSLFCSFVVAHLS